MTVPVLQPNGLRQPFGLFQVLLSSQQACFESRLRAKRRSLKLFVWDRKVDQ